MDQDILDIEIPVDTILLIEYGEYSDFNYRGPVRVIRAFTKREVANAYRREMHTEEDKQWGISLMPNEFMPWLVRNGYVEAVDCTVWNVGAFEFRP